MCSSDLRTKKDLDQVSKIIKKFKVKCKSYICDITNYNEIKEIINKQSRIDVLINNAGTNIPEYFTKVKRQNMEYLVKINTITSFNIAQLCTLKRSEEQRLNSSHVVISYAVFCLKKKKKRKNKK